MAIIPIPDRVYRRVTDIDPSELARRGTKLLLADLDNCLARYGQSEPEPEVVAWRERLREAGVALFLLSNSRRPTRVSHYAQALDIPVLGRAGKPGGAGYRKAMAQMGCTPAETAMVGDQIFTDILGAKRAGVTALLVEPIELAGNPGRYLRYAVETPFRAAGRHKTNPF
ncbi:HAD phosphatase, family IIIA [uncultured Eubacteriales bacterium]|uniref:HAD phosphatase, family IIIA n=1 Tax=uncultured Eubacteriales bacterium TaxID=172733 RepID=A0A212K4H3_9FIRM|nr:HAD phosphatase, family IIIA [uncultured Eubacteriales bacterium]